MSTLIPHPQWCTRDLCTVSSAGDVAHREVGDFLAPRAEPLALVTLSRVRLDDYVTEIVLGVGDDRAPLSRDEARDLSRLLARYANDATT